MLPAPIEIIEPSVDGSVLWAVHYDKAKRSVDDGQNWTNIKTFTRGADSFLGLFVDSNDNLFISRNNMGVLVKGVWAGGDTLTCTDVLTYDCATCPATYCGGFWHMAEDAKGDLYGGEYNGEMSDTCAVVWKSVDSGDNWTRIRWAQGDRHIHFVAVDPVSDALYVSVGDGTGHQMILKSDDAGATFTTIWDTGCWGQPISFAFTGSARIFGSDCAYSTNCIYRTPDDVNFKAAITFSGTEDNFVWAMTKDPNGNLIAGTTGNGHGNDSNDVRLYGSHNGLRWYTLKNFADNDDWTGVLWLSQRFDDQGYGYYTVTEDDGAGVDTYRYKLTHTAPVEHQSGHKRTPSRRR